MLHWKDTETWWAISVRVMVDVWWDHQSFLQSTLSIILRQHTTTTSHEWLSTTDEPLYQRFSQVPPLEQRLQEGGGGGGGIEFKQWSSTSHSTFSMCVFLSDFNSCRLQRLCFFRSSPSLFNHPWILLKLDLGYVWWCEFLTFFCPPPPTIIILVWMKWSKWCSDWILCFNLGILFNASVFQNVKTCLVFFFLLDVPILRKWDSLFMSLWYPPRAIDP